MKINIDLAPLSAFKIGGKAKEYIRVYDSDELLKTVIRLEAENKKFILFAGGSNIVFPDKGIDPVVVHVLGGNLKKEDTTLVVDSGVLLSDVVDLAINNKLGGLETLSGIPGTIGGAIFGNAGAYGHSIGEYVEQVKVFENGKVLWLSQKECQFAYRDSIFKTKKCVILQIYVKLKNDNTSDLFKISQEIIHLREKKYKKGIMCPGSFFKNIQVEKLTEEQRGNIDDSWIKYNKIPAGVLLEAVGAKGMKVGRIEVAHHHGNLLVNTGNGKASEVKKLASELKERVKRKFGIEIEEEIRYL